MSGWGGEGMKCNLWCERKVRVLDFQPGHSVFPFFNIWFVVYQTWAEPLIPWTSKGSLSTHHWLLQPRSLSKTQPNLGWLLYPQHSDWGVYVTQVALKLSCQSCDRPSKSPLGTRSVLLNPFFQVTGELYQALTCKQVFCLGDYLAPCSFLIPFSPQKTENVPEICFVCKGKSKGR